MLALQLFVYFIVFKMHLRSRVFVIGEIDVASEKAGLTNVEICAFK